MSNGHRPTAPGGANESERKTRCLYVDAWGECDARCKHCFNNGGTGSRPFLTNAELLNFIRLAQSQLKITEIQLTGGEPTLRPDLLALLDELLDCGLYVKLQSNGLFGSDLREKLMALPAERLSLIVSLDGIDTNEYLRGDGSTRTIIGNLVELSGRFSIRVNCVLTSRIKWHEIEQLVELADRLDVDLAFNPMCPSGRAESDLLMPPEQYFEWMFRLAQLQNPTRSIRTTFRLTDGKLSENARCPVRQGRAFHVAADGQVYPCGFLAGVDPLYMGNALVDSPSELVAKAPAVCRELAEECQGCSLFADSRCHGGCPARIRALHGCFDVPDVYCLASYERK